MSSGDLRYLCSVCLALGVMYVVDCVEEKKNPFTLWKGMQGDMEYLSFTQRGRSDGKSSNQVYFLGRLQLTGQEDRNEIYTWESYKHCNSPAFVRAYRQSSGCLKEKWQFVSSSNLVKYTLWRGNTVFPV